MSISYTVYFENPQEIEGFTDKLQKALELRLDIKRQQKGYEIVGIPDLQVFHLPVGALGSLLVKEDYGFTPHLCLSIRLDKWQLEKSQDRMVSLFCACIQSTEGAILALREHESSVFYRREDRFEMNVRDAVWYKRSRKVRFQAFLKTVVTLPIVEVSEQP